MICLDTNYLILGVREGSPEAAELVGWFQQGEELIVASPAWYEFLCGPVTGAQIAAITAFLSRVIPFSELEASKAAELFNLAGRRRALRFDSMIAATAITAGARLATNNLSNFEVFVPHGLNLA